MKFNSQPATNKTKAKTVRLISLMSDYPDLFTKTPSHRLSVALKHAQVFMSRIRKLLLDHRWKEKSLLGMLHSIA